MKKITGTILFVSAFFALATASATVLFEAERPLTAQAQTVLETNLLSPLSYEEYLPLVAPSDVSATDALTAIADDNDVYLYNGNEYYKYEHSSKISKLQVWDTTVYFLDGSDEMYTLSVDVDNLSATVAQDAHFSCRTFAIEDDYLYCRKGNNNVLKYPLNALSGTGETLVTDLEYNEYTPFAFWNGNVCYFKGNTLYQAGNTKAIATFPYSVTSMTVTGNVIALTTGSNFYAYNLNELNSFGSPDNAELLSLKSGNYKSLSSNGEEIYAISGGSVWQFSASENFAIKKEICRTSASANRLKNATALTLSGGKLFIADNGNQRVSIYDTASGEYLLPIPTAFPPERLSSYKDTVLLASATQAAVYSLSSGNYGTALLSVTNVNGEIVGATAVYDKYYILTNTNHCYICSPSETGWTVTEHIRKNVAGDKLTSDVYGYLYITTGNDVYRYTEAQFLDSNGVGEKLLSEIPTNVREIAVDYDRNLYLLTANGLYKYAGTDAPQTFSLGSALVYGQTPSALSFALSAENNTAYLLFNGDYLATTNSLNLPSMSALPTGDSYKQIYENEAELHLVKAKAGAVLIQFDVQNLKTDTAVFPYVGFNRISEEKQALKLGSTGKYDILALTDDDKDGTYLALSSDCATVSESEYVTNYGQALKTGYVSNAVPLLKFPRMHFSLPTLSSALKKNSAVTLTGELHLEQTYYQIAYVDENGTQLTGYLPASYVSLFNGEPPEPQTRVYGENSSDTDSVWRLWYILLGAGAICILTDYLLLRPRSKTEENK